MASITAEFALRLDIARRYRLAGDRANAARFLAATAVARGWITDDARSYRALYGRSLFKAVGRRTYRITLNGRDCWLAPATRKEAARELRFWRGRARVTGATLGFEVLDTVAA